jgi:KaiC/GvpD/RAD55 family RecA-like ATPase
MAIDAGGPPSWHDDAPAEVVQLRTPPYSAEAEQAVLGCLISFPDTWDRVSDLLADSDFYSQAHRMIFAGLKELLDAGQVVDIVTVFERLQAQGIEKTVGGLPYLNQLAQGVPGPDGVRRYAEIVRERSIRRKVIAASDEIASQAFNAQGRSLDDLLTGFESELSQLQRECTRKLIGSRVPLMTLDGLRQSSEAVRWLIKGVMPAESIGLLFGGSGTFKSFIALDAALHVAHGLPWMGRKTKQGPVLYIAAEGGSGLWPRIDAWHRARRMRWTGLPMYVVPAAVSLSTEAWRVVDAAQAQGVTPSMVVVDTLSQTFSGEENSANEVALYLRELGTRFRALWGCTVLVIHHSGHQATERPRGSSALRANVDFMLGVQRDEKELLATLSCQKQKDGDAFQDTTFSLRSHTLGEDEDGDSVSSLVAWHLSSAEALQEAMEAENKAGRGGRNQMLLSLLQNGMREVDLRKAFYDECGLDDNEARKKAYQRAKAWCQKSGFFEVAGGTVITLKAGE